MRPSPRPSAFQSLPHGGPRREGGVAAITAILIVAVAASAATVMLSQQAAMIDQVALVAARAQADQYAQAGVDWARGILVQDLRGGPVDSLDEAWAKPIAALPVERAIVSGALADEQGKFNVNNLLEGTRRSNADAAAFGRLLASLGLAPELTDALVDWIDPDSDLSSGNGAEDPYYLSLPRPYRAANQPMVQVEELYRVKGFDAATVARLRPYVSALPTRTTLNINTASAAVIAAVLPEVPREKIEALLRERVAKPLRSRQEIVQWAQPVPIPDSVDVKSGYFSVRVQVAQDEVELSCDALLRRADSGVTSVVWRRPRY
jgi:general secretion pathway protein K